MDTTKKYVHVLQQVKRNLLITTVETDWNFYVRKMVKKIPVYNKVANFAGNPFPLSTFPPSLPPFSFTYRNASNKRLGRLIISRGHRGRALIREGANLSGMLISNPPEIQNQIP